jgi:hypothetical protein
MFKMEELKQLSDFLLEEFKTIFVTKEDLDKVDKKIDNLTTSVDGLAKRVEENTHEIKAVGHRVDRMEGWMIKAAPKIDLEYKP